MTVLEDMIRRGWHPVPSHEGFRKRLRALELSCCSSGSKDGDSDGANRVGNTRHKRRFWPDDDKTDLEVLSKSGQSFCAVI